MAARFRVVLVGPKSEGNVGAVARIAKNFGVEELVLVDPPRLGDETRARAMHAWDLVERARVVRTFQEGIRGCDFVVGTSARIPQNEKRHLRNPLEARDLPRRLAEMGGVVGLCFGREDFGLLNEELEQCDVLVTIPTSDRYRSLNLSHAVAVVLYELFVHRMTEPVKTLRPMSEDMKRTFERAMDALIDRLDLPPHKVKGTKTVYRRLFGRAVPSAWEYFVFMGILSAVLKRYGVDLEGSREYEADFELPPDLEADVATLLDRPSGPGS